MVIERLSEFPGVSNLFVSHFRGILAASTQAEALSHAVAAIEESLAPRTITVTDLDIMGEPVIVANYRDGQVWDWRIGEVVPKYALARTILKTGRAVFWDVHNTDVDAPDWFLYPYFIGVPITSSEKGADDLSGTFVLSFDSERFFTDESAAIASVVAAAYSTVLDGSTRVDVGIEIGRSLEQERMVQRLHDTSVQEIFACQCKVESMLGMPELSASQRDELQELRGLLKQANADLRQVLCDASRRPAGGRLVPALEIVDKAIEVHTAQGGCPVALVVDEDLRVSRTLAAILESVLAESLANVRKHAHADNVVISCSEMSQTLVLTVQDDGVGYQPNLDDNNESTPAFETAGNESPTRSLHFGLANMSNMVRRVAGTFSVSSDPDEGGTAVHVRIPMTEEMTIGDRSR